MKQVVQSYKTGQVALREVPAPGCGGKRVLVRNAFSLISLGTERSTIELGRKSLLGKAASRPDLVRRAWDKAKKEGLIKTWQEAMGRLDTPTPLGYSSCGIVEQCGVAATEFSPGDRVACVGQGFASHAEFVSIPVNLTCRIPDGVELEEAAFGMLGIIALHGVRTANLTFGSRVVVLGLGLLGLITIQILRAYGCEVVALDPAADKVELAQRLGFGSVTTDGAELARLCDVSTMGYGADAVIITAASKERDLVDQAITLCRMKGRIVVVGTADIHPDRNDLWLKEIELVVSRAAGPGSLDPLYELEGVDLPIEDVRWTQKRNLQEFLRLIAARKIDLLSLVTHRVPINDAETIYSQFIAGQLVRPIGVLLSYPSAAEPKRLYPTTQHAPSVASASNVLHLGVVGAGLFGKALLLPALKAQKDIVLETLATGSGASVEHTARKFGFVQQTTDAAEIWSDKKIQAVVGITPHSQHADLVRAALDTNKALFLEKPICTTEDELLELRQLASRVSAVPLILIGHNRRFSPHTVQIKKWLADRRAPLVMQVRVNAGFVPSSHWVHSEAEGRSRIVGELSHFVDLIQCVAESPIVRVSAERVSGDNRSVVNNDNFSLNFKLADGSVGALVYSASGDKAYSREMFEIFSGGQTIVSRDFRVTELHRDGKVERFKTSSQEMGYLQELEHFMSGVRKGGVPLVALSDAFATMDVIFAIERSLARAETVSIAI